MVFAAFSAPRFTSQNESVSAVSLRAFLGQDLVHRFSIDNPEGVALRFSLVVPVHLTRHFEPRISNDGKVFYNPFVSCYSIKKIY